MLVRFAFPVALIPAVTEQYLSVGGTVVDPQPVVVPIALPINANIKNQIPDYRPEITMEVEDLCKQMSSSQFQLEEELLAVEKTIQQKKEFLLIGMEQEKWDLENYGHVGDQESYGFKGHPTEAIEA